MTRKGWPRHHETCIQLSRSSNQAPLCSFTTSQYSIKILNLFVRQCIEENRNLMSQSFPRSFSSEKACFRGLAIAGISYSQASIPPLVSISCTCISNAGSMWSTLKGPHKDTCSNNIRKLFHLRVNANVKL